MKEVIAGKATQAPGGGEIVRMSGAKLNNMNPLGPALKPGTFDPSVTYVVTVVNGVPQEAKEAGGGYQEGGEVAMEDATPGMFDTYLERGVSQEIIDQGNELSERIQQIASAPDSSTKEQFMQDVKNFISAVESEREIAMEEGDPEKMRAMKELMAEAKDLLASFETILEEASNMDVENYPEMYDEEVEEVV